MNQKNNNNQYCTECGAKIEGGNYCQECGKKIENNPNKEKVLKGFKIAIGICIIIFIATIIFSIIIGADYPTNPHFDKIDGVIVHIPAGYKHIETKDIAVGGQVLKTATYKNRNGQTITISKMTESEMYIMGHGKKIPENTTVNNPDGSTGVLKKRNNNYILITADNQNIINSL